MAEYRIQETGAVVTESELRAMHPNTSFPYVLTEELVNDLGADVVFEGPQPTATKYQVVYRDGVEQIEGKWYTKYSVADMDDEAKAAVDAATIVANKALRNTKLDNTDWTQLADVPLTADCKTAFAAYRQALRDLDMLDPAWPDAPAEEWAS
jgi:hypothetical protein